jgi:hypothetical protein
VVLFVELFPDSGHMRRGAYAVVVRKPVGNRPLVNPAYRGKNNIKTNPKKSGRGGRGLA